MRLVFLAFGLLGLACSSSNEGGDGGAGSSTGATSSGGSAGTGGGSAGTTAGGTGGGSAGADSGGSAGTDAGGTGGSDGGSGGTAGGGGTPTAWTCPEGPFDADPVPDDASLAPIAGMPPADNYQQGGWHNIEGPVWIDGALFVSQITQVGSPPQARMLKLLDGAVSVANPDSGTNGLAIGLDGMLYMGRHLDGSISVADPADPTTVTGVITMHDGARFNSPNDLAFRSDGNLYFSDPDYQKPSGAAPQQATRVYRVAPGATTADVVDDSLGQPNGVTLSLDENTLFVLSSGGLYQYPINADGTTGSGMLVNGAPTGDGMGLDCAGNLYVTAGTRVAVLDTTLTEIDSVDVPGVEWVTNVAFGGPEHKTLFITYLGNTTAGAFSIELNVPGKPY